MNGFGHPGKFRTDGHDERARFLNHAMGPPIRVGFSMLHRGLRVEMAAHWLDAFLPGIVVQDKIAEARMAFKNQTEQILGLAFVPVRRMNKFDDARESFFGQRRGGEHVNPAGFAFTVKTVAQLPFARSLLDDQARKTEIPFQKKPSAKFRQRGAAALDFAR